MTSRRPRAFSTEAVVLRHSDLGEADRLLTLLTPARGILRATARGARRPTSKLGGHLDLLCYASLSVHEGRSLHTITQADTISAFREMRRDIGRLSHGLYLAELAGGFSVEDAPAPAVFRLLVNALGWLESADSPDLLVRWFELRLLSLTGFRPELYACVECSSALEAEDHVFSPERGGIVCPACRGTGSDVLLPAAVPTIKVLRYLDRNDYATVAGLQVDDEERRPVERLLRGHLHAVLDRSPRSAAFLDEVRRWPDAGPVPGGLQPPAPASPPRPPPAS
ncbi:MAG: DNA repair protein RecO [Dehalococcoidia bacterium]